MVVRGVMTVVVNMDVAVWSTFVAGVESFTAVIEVNVVLDCAGMVVGGVIVVVVKMDEVVCLTFVAGIVIFVVIVGVNLVVLKVVVRFEKVVHVVVD